MKLTVREFTLDDLEKIVDYFLLSDHQFLEGMGADKSKLPQKVDWLKKLESELKLPSQKKDFYYIIWELDHQAVGHSNINNIEYGNSATMHLHLWENQTRKKGLGLEFLKLTIPLYFKHFQLKKLICEPYSKNVAPNKTLKKLDFNRVKTYDTIPGWINFHQTVHRYELTKEQFEESKIYL